MMKMGLNVPGVNTPQMGFPMGMIPPGFMPMAPTNATVAPKQEGTQVKEEGI